ncbi:hypothetical protein [Novipirellula artificiosorum]|uniref:Outer membrane protein beta-barrel domain-containing protein n=1 Tax=Novipirellula artificiosorum TaxID=2528016 RepID=A0A5C6DLQ2_9BACT|nr:hypothetical protein [Novipirellula artificiosorum]TWU35856.1 hypothetical protein Poly41_36070 [Novipirellula artificiosorum]
MDGCKTAAARCCFHFKPASHLFACLMLFGLGTHSSPALGQWAYADPQPVQNDLSYTRHASPINSFHNLDLPAPYCYEPTFGAEVGGLALLRVAPDAFPMVYSDSSELMATSDIVEPEMKLGYRVAATFFNLSRQVPGIDTEFAFFTVGGMIAESTIDTNTSLVDLQIGGHAWVSSWASLQIAYQGLFLSDAVGAVEQSNSQSFFDSATQTPAFHDITWHGLHAGLKMIW